MIWIYILISVVLIVQIAIFVMGKRIRSREKENNVLLKYNIDSRQKAWQLMADPSIPEEDRKEIKKIYDGEEN